MEILLRGTVAVLSVKWKKDGLVRVIIAQLCAEILSLLVSTRVVMTEIQKMMTDALLRVKLKTDGLVKKQFVVQHVEI